MEFAVYNERVEDIVDLIQYSYANTPDLLDPIDGLRSLVVHFTACFVETMTNNTEFGLLLQEAGPFARDLIKRVLERLD